MDDLQVFKVLQDQGFGAAGAFFLVLAFKYFAPFIKNIGIKNEKPEVISDKNDPGERARIEARIDELRKELERICKDFEAEKADIRKELSSIRSHVFNLNGSLQRLIGMIEG